MSSRSTIEKLSVPFSSTIQLKVCIQRCTSISQLKLNTMLFGKGQSYLGKKTNVLLPLRFCKNFRMSWRRAKKEKGGGVNVNAYFQTRMWQKLHSSLDVEILEVGSTPWTLHHALQILFFAQNTNVRMEVLC